MSFCRGSLPWSWKLQFYFWVRNYSLILFVVLISKFASLSWFWPISFKQSDKNATWIESEHNELPIIEAIFLVFTLLCTEAELGMLNYSRFPLQNVLIEYIYSPWVIPQSCKMKQLNVAIPCTYAALWIKQIPKERQSTRYYEMIFYVSSDFESKSWLSCANNYNNNYSCQINLRTDMMSLTEIS